MHCCAPICTITGLNSLPLAWVVQCHANDYVILILMCNLYYVITMTLHALVWVPYLMVSFSCKHCCNVPEHIVALPASRSMYSDLPIATSVMSISVVLHQHMPPPPQLWFTFVLSARFVHNHITVVNMYIHAPCMVL